MADIFGEAEQVLLELPPLRFALGGELLFDQGADALQGAADSFLDAVVHGLRKQADERLDVVAGLAHLFEVGLEVGGGFFAPGQILLDLLAGLLDHGLELLARVGQQELALLGDLLTEGLPDAKEECFRLFAELPHGLELGFCVGGVLTAAFQVLIHGLANLLGNLLQSLLGLFLEALPIGGGALLEVSAEAHQQVAQAFAVGVFKLTGDVLGLALQGPLKFFHHFADVGQRGHGSGRWRRGFRGRGCSGL